MNAFRRSAMTSTCAQAVLAGARKYLEAMPFLGLPKHREELGYRVFVTDYDVGFMRRDLGVADTLFEAFSVAHSIRWPYGFGVFTFDGSFRVAYTNGRNRWRPSP